MKITIEGDEDSPETDNLYTHAVVELIEGADTNGWAKGLRDRLSADQYYAAVLTAVRRHYIADSSDWEGDERQGVPALIERLLKQLQYNSKDPFPPLNLGLDEDEDDEDLDLDMPSST